MENVSEKTVTILAIIESFLGIFIALNQLELPIQGILGCVWIFVFVVLLLSYKKNYDYINFIEYLCNNNRHRFNLLPRFRIYMHQHKILNKIHVRSLDITYQIDGKKYQNEKEPLYGDVTITYKYEIEKTSTSEFIWIYGNDYAEDPPLINVKYGSMKEYMQIGAEPCSCPPYMKSVVRCTKIEFLKDYKTEGKIWPMEIKVFYKKAFDFENLDLDTIICLPMLYGNKIDQMDYHIQLHNYSEAVKFYFFPYKIIKKGKGYDCPIQTYERKEGRHTQFDVKLGLEDVKKEYAFYFRLGTSPSDIEAKF